MVGKNTGDDIVSFFEDATFDDIIWLFRSGYHKLLTIIGRHDLVTDELAKKLEGTDQADRQWAALSLRDMGEKAVQALPVLVGALNDEDEDPETRIKAAEALGNLGEAAAPAVPALIDAMKSHRARGDVQHEAKNALVKIGKPAVRPLLKASKDREADAMEVLVRIGKPAVGPLIGALESEDPDLRAFAVRALREIGDARAVGPLIKSLGDSWGNISYDAMVALAKIGKPAVGPLIGALENEDLHICVRAVSALGLIGEGAVDALPALHQFALRERGVKENVKNAIKDIASDAKRPSGVRRISERPKDAEIEMMFKRMASDVRQPKRCRVAGL